MKKPFIKTPLNIILQTLFNYFFIFMKRLKSAKAFILLELIVSIWIISIAVFGIYKLLSSNTSSINDLENNLNANLLMINLSECLEKIWYDFFYSNSWTNNFSYNFWTDNKTCLTWSYDSWFTFTWFLLNWSDYFLYTDLSSIDDDYISLDLNVEKDDWLKVETDYKLYK